MPKPIKKISNWLFGNYLKGIRRLSFILFILIYSPFIKLIHLDDESLLKERNHPLIVVTEPTTIIGEENQFLVAQINGLSLFRVTGATKFWRIFHECQRHNIFDSLSRKSSSECQHPDNWVETNENLWHQYAVLYGEEIRVPYSNGVKIEIQQIPRKEFSQENVDQWRVLFTFLSTIVYFLLNIDLVSRKNQ